MIYKIEEWNNAFLYLSRVVDRILLEMNLPDFNYEFLKDHRDVASMKKQQQDFCVGFKETLYNYFLNNLSEYD